MVIDKSMKASLLSLLIPTLLLGGACSLVTVIPPSSGTLTTMSTVRVRMEAYLASNDHYPDALSDLPRRDGYADSETDGWGRPLGYAIDEQGVVTLSSFGRDGQPGGEGEDADIALRYAPRTEDGSYRLEEIRR